MTAYEYGFIKRAAELGYDGRAILAKMAQEAGPDDGSVDVTEVSTDGRIGKDERKILLSQVPEDKRKLIKKFLNKINDKGLYAVRTNEYGSPTATYDSTTGRLYYTKAQQEERDRRIKGKNSFWRMFFMGGQPLVSI